MKNRVRYFKWMLMVLMICSSYSAYAHESEYVTPRHVAEKKKKQEPKPSWGHRILWYVPNRVLDVTDIVRCRIRVGKGWAATLRMSEPVSSFAGSYKTHYIGFPGPRYPKRVKGFYGREEYKGLQFGLADATDESLYEPEYTASEFALGAHLGYVGADLGTDPVEILDGVLGFFFYDLKGDDL